MKISLDGLIILFTLVLWAVGLRMYFKKPRNPQYSAFMGIGLFLLLSRMLIENYADNTKAMSTYEVTYLILITVQTGFLMWYAVETMRLRKSAEIQSDLVSKQLQAALDATEHQKNSEARRIADAEKRQKFAEDKLKPYYETNGAYTFDNTFFVNVIDTGKQTKRILEYRSNDPKNIKVRMFNASQHESSHDCNQFIIEFQNTAVVYIGISCLTALGKVNTVFEVTRLGKEGPLSIKSLNESEYNYDTLQHLPKP